jgi:hypothetical protein
LQIKNISRKSPEKREGFYIISAHAGLFNLARRLIKNTGNRGDLAGQQNLKALKIPG